MKSGAAAPLRRGCQGSARDHARLRSLPAPHKKVERPVAAAPDVHDFPQRRRAAWLVSAACAAHTRYRTAAGRVRRSTPLALKLESLQLSGSFKGRGAFHKLLASDVPKAGIVAASGGTMVSPRPMPPARSATSRDLRADHRLAGQGRTAQEHGAIVHQSAPFMPRRARCRRSARPRPARSWCRPTRTRWWFAGAGSVALEFAEQAGFDTLLVAVGGGGLIAGCAVAVGEQVKIVAVETEGTPTLYEARRAGRPVT